jgi:membrane protease YdiL (CAAX protease family)
LKIWIFAALLILWGNLLHPLIGSSAVLPGGSWQFVLAGAFLIGGSLLVARSLGLSADALGLRRAEAGRGAAIGVLAAGAIALVAVLVLRLTPSIIGQPVGYSPLARVSGDELAWHITLYLPLGAVIPEELAFRGTLLGGLLARSGVRGAVIVSAIAFALWHTTVAMYTVGDSALSQTVFFAPAVVGAVLVVFVGGVVMAGLRAITGTLATSIAAHWVFNAVILVGLWIDRPVH